jgi:biotin operon repressor
MGESSSTYGKSRKAVEDRVNHIRSMGDQILREGSYDLYARFCDDLDAIEDRYISELTGEDDE